MSLDALTNIRLSGKAPTAVWLIAGDAPKVAIESPSVVTVSPRDDVPRLDLRALVGLHVDVFESGDYPELLDKVLTAVDAAKPKSTGLACKAGICGLNDAHERVLRRVRELICN